jgi:gas vesicle protein
MSTCEYRFSGRTVILSLSLGAIAGAAAVLLLAPNVRRESAERISKLGQDLKARASATVNSARERVSSAVSRGRDFLDEERSVISSAVEAGKEAYARRKAQAPSAEDA